MSASLIGRFGSSAFQTIHHHSVDVAHGLVLLFGIGTKALPIWGSKTRRNNLWVGLVVSVTAGPSGHANSPRPSSREGHHSTARWSSSCLLLGLMPCASHAAAACSRVQRNSVPSTHMRCMVTASRRAKATIAFFNPRRLAIAIAHALSQDHFVVRTSRIWPLRRGSPASSHLRTGISHRFDRSRPIDTWTASVRTPPRPPWSF